MIGYGLADTEVVSIDRRSQDGILVLAMWTTEADLIGSLGSTDVASVLTYNPSSDAYLWYKTVSNVDTSRVSHVYFTADGNRVLFFHYQVSQLAVLFFDADTGANLGSTGFKKDVCCGSVYGKDTLTMNSDGSKVFMIHQRNGW